MKTKKNRQFVVLAALAAVLSLSTYGCSDVPQERYSLNQAALVSVGGDSSIPLLAGQHIPVGTVELFVEDDDLVVAYSLMGGWELEETHLWIGESLAELPQTRTGNPIPGRFPYKSGDITGTTYYEVRVSLESLGGEPYVCDETFYVVAHAAVRRLLDDGSYQGETAYGEGERLVRRGNWATYFTFELQCEEEEGPPVGNGCETAYALGDTTFIELGITNARWGWQIEVSEYGLFSTPIYAGAAQNDISKGTYVGELEFIYDGELLTVNYLLLSGFGLVETHVYAGDTHVDTVAPGLYGHTHSNLGLVWSDTFEIAQSGLPIYLVAHAVVCETGFLIQ